MLSNLLFNIMLLSFLYFFISYISVYTDSNAVYMQDGILRHSLMSMKVFGGSLISITGRISCAGLL